MQDKVKDVVMLVVLIIIMGALLPIVIGAVSTSGATGVAATLLGYIPLFIVLGAALGIIMISIGWLGSKGE